MIKNKSVEEIRQQFNIKNDFTPQEEEQVSQGRVEKKEECVGGWVCVRMVEREIGYYIPPHKGQAKQSRTKSRTKANTACIACFHHHHHRCEGKTSGLRISSLKLPLRAEPLPVRGAVLATLTLCAQVHQAALRSRPLLHHVITTQTSNKTKQNKGHN